MDQKPAAGTSCLFCKIAAGAIPSKAVAIAPPELAKEVYAFEDIHPQAPSHILIIPRRHLASLNELGPSDAELVGKLVLAAQGIARERQFSERGYRLVLNTNAAAGQTVFHLHIHLLGGRNFTWPPG
ncbi:MAG: histidine triad nucleotide-binding protein [Planctomycetes bacterium]|nr:histidine triad nucleotide-binding protein [Planctomycetota bacterium]